MGLMDKILGNACELELDKVAEEYAHILIDGEKLERAFVMIRDVFIFTCKRLILIDKQGITG